MATGGPSSDRKAAGGSAIGRAKALKPVAAQSKTSAKTPVPSDTDMDRVDSDSGDFRCQAGTPTVTPSASTAFWL